MYTYNTLTDTLKMSTAYNRYRFHFEKFRKITKELYILYCFAGKNTLITSCPGLF